MTINLELNHRPHSNGLHLIIIRLTKNRKHFRTSSEIYVKKEHFNKNAEYGKWIEKDMDRKTLNEALETKMREVKLMYLQTADVSPDNALMVDGFFKFAEDFIKQYDNKDTEGTYEQYKAKLAKLKKYAGDKLKFSQIDTKFLRNYFTYLRGLGNSVNTISVDMKKLRAIINQAIIDKIVKPQDSPFLSYKIKTTITSKEKLDGKELNKIRNIKLDGYLWHARNTFLFCINCMGMRIGAALKLKRAQINKDEIYYQAGKGGKNKNLQLTAEAKKIVNYYLKETEGTYLFPYLEGCTNEHRMVKTKTALINKALKLIAKKAEVNKTITTHVARHTLTKAAIDSGIDMRTLQGMLGHSTVAITENYAGDISDQKGNDAMKRVKLK